MEEKKYSITLADGTVLKNLKKNGDNYISGSKVTEDQFVDNSSPVVISDGETEDIHENMELLQIQKYGKEYWFVLAEISPEQMEKIKMQSDIEYLAMMAGVEL